MGRNVDTQTEKNSDMIESAKSMYRFILTEIEQLKTKVTFMEEKINQTHSIDKHQRAQNQKKQVQIHCFPTYVRSIKKIRYLQNHPLHKTNTSTSHSQCQQTTALAKKKITVAN